MLVLGFHGHKLHWLSELGVLDVFALNGSLSSWSQGLCFSGRRLELRVTSWLHGVVPGIGFMVRLCLRLSNLFPCGYFLICLMYRNLLAILDFFRRNCLVCLWEERSSGVFCAAILVDLYTYILNCYILLVNWELYHFAMILSILNSAVSLKVYSIWY